MGPADCWKRSSEVYPPVNQCFMHILYPWRPFLTNFSKFIIIPTAKIEWFQVAQYTTHKQSGIQKTYSNIKRIMLQTMKLHMHADVTTVINLLKI